MAEQRSNQQVTKPTAMKDQISQLWTAVLGNGAVGLIGRMDAVERKIDDHAKWHLAQRAAIMLAAIGWLVAVGLGAWAIFGGG